MTERRGLRRLVGGVRARIVVWYLALFAITLGVTVLTIRQVLIVRLDDEIDRSLAQEVDELRLLAGGTDPDTGEPFGPDSAAIFDTFLARNVPSEGEALFTLVAGEPFATSAAPPLDLLEDESLAERWAATTRPTYGAASTSEGPVRWLAVPITSGSAGDRDNGVFVVANFYGPDREDIDQAMRIVVGVSGAVLGLATIFGWVTAGRVIAPLRTLTDTARGISDDDLSSRIPVVGDDEVAELTATFNAMLDRLESAFEVQRTFLSDVGHDLRTPLTIIRGHLELLPDDPAERQATVELCTDELDRMTRYVNDLALLARAERPDFLRLGSVDVPELVDGMHSRATALAPDRRWIVERIAATTITADAERVVQALVNLVANAAQHTTAGDEIRLGADVTDREVSLWVHDTGPGIAADEQARIFQRFARGDASTQRRPEGSGLGLAIVSAIARAHNGRVDVDSAPGRGARFALVLPTGLSPDVDHEEAAWPGS